LIAAAMVGMATVSLSAGPARVVTATPDLMLRNRYPASERVVTELDNARRIEVLEDRIASLEATIQCSEFFWRTHASTK
jgi:hypothetical protein